ncbi:MULTISPECIES: hypothetical protein [unclassified Bradyrhizobium]|uniref:hypothetical protein n=1 Tax=unclassified Bradyrhizobium TaxID=2631580 RepID=UPI003512F4E7
MKLSTGTSDGGDRADIALLGRCKADELSTGAAEEAGETWRSTKSMSCPISRHAIERQVNQTVEGRSHPRKTVAGRLTAGFLVNMF